jgi:hypothetical protein
MARVVTKHGSIQAKASSIHVARLTRRRRDVNSKASNNATSTVTASGVSTAARASGRGFAASAPGMLQQTMVVAPSCAAPGTRRSGRPVRERVWCTGGEDTIATASFCGAAQKSSCSSASKEQFPRSNSHIRLSILGRKRNSSGVARDTSSHQSMSDALKSACTWPTVWFPMLLSTKMYSRAGIAFVKISSLTFSTPMTGSGRFIRISDPAMRPKWMNTFSSCGAFKHKFQSGETTIGEPALSSGF